MKQVKTFSEYINDESRVLPAEREKTKFEVELIGKIVGAREEKGLSQHELAQISGEKLEQPNKETIAAMLEAERIARDPGVKRCSDVEEALRELKAIEDARNDIGLSRGFTSVSELMEDLDADE